MIIIYQSSPNMLRLAPSFNPSPKIFRCLVPPSCTAASTAERCPAEQWQLPTRVGHPERSLTWKNRGMSSIEIPRIFWAT